MCEKNIIKEKQCLVAEKPRIHPQILETRVQIVYKPREKYMAGEALID